MQPWTCPAIERELTYCIPVRAVVSVFLGIYQNLTSQCQVPHVDTDLEISFVFQMNKLQKELEDRRHHYMTEMEDIDGRREQQK